MMEKKCRDCSVVKPLDYFYSAPQCEMKVRPECKECTRKRQRLYNARPEVKKRTKEYHSHPLVRDRQNAARRSPAGLARYREKVQRTPSYVLSFALYRALKRRPTENPVTHSQLMEMYYQQNGLCALSGVKMTWMREKIRPTSISIDRIDSTKGYTFDNVRLLCHAVNRMKGDASD